MNASRSRIITARVLAVVADAVQLAFIPMFVEGAASPVNDVVDVVVGAAMIALVGWHWVFVPAFLAELLPVADLAPTWTLAVMIATRQGAGVSARAGTPPGRTESEAGPPRLPAGPSGGPGGAGA